METQRGEETCPGSHSLKVVELGFDPRSSKFKGQAWLLTTWQYFFPHSLPKFLIHTMGFLISSMPFQLPARTTPLVRATHPMCTAMGRLTTGLREKGKLTLYHPVCTFFKNDESMDGRIDE